MSNNARRYYAGPIEEVASLLLDKADRIVSGATWSGAIVGGLIGFILSVGGNLGNFYRFELGLQNFIWIVVIGAVGAWVNRSRVSLTALMLKAQANLLLAQVQIERNTRSTSESLLK